MAFEQEATQVPAEILDIEVHRKKELDELARGIARATQGDVNVEVTIPRFGWLSSPFYTVTINNQCLCAGSFYEVNMAMIACRRLLLYTQKVI